jgi:hypothetical protein
MEKKLVVANLGLLNRAISQDKKLKIFINTPLEDLSRQYKQVVGEMINNKETLLDLIKLSFMFELLWFGSTVFKYFYTVKDKIIGFAGYIANSDDVESIKVFTFYPSEDGEAVLFDDFEILINKLITEYKTVSWFSNKEDLSNKIYQQIIEKYNGDIETECNGFRYKILT